jgi:molecular chaperone IbpA
VSTQNITLLTRLKGENIMGNQFDITPFYRNFVGIDRLFNELDRLVAAPDTSGYPPCNVLRSSDEQYILELAVAGFSQEDIDIQVKDGLLTIIAAKKEADQREYLHKGIGTRAFTRNFRLTDYMVVKGAAMKDGLLTVTLEREIPEEAKPKRIAIASM